MDNLLKLLGFDSGPIESGDPEALLERYVRSDPRWMWRDDKKMKALDEAVLALPPEDRIRMIRAAVAVRVRSRDWTRAVRLRDLLILLARRKLPYSEDDVRFILRQVTRPGSFHLYALPTLVRGLGKAIRERDMLERCRAELEALQRAAAGWHDVGAADRRKLDKVLFELLHHGDSAPLRLRNDEWGAQALAALEEMPESERASWSALLAYCAGASGSKPSRKWLAPIAESIESLGRERFSRLAAEWLGLFAASRNRPPGRQGPGRPYDQGSLLHEENSDLLKGLAWACGGAEDERLATALTDAAIAGYRKLSGHGPRSQKVAGACLWALREMPGLAGAVGLERLRLSVKQPSVRKKVLAALEAAAARAGVSRGDLEERTVPDFGLANGRREWRFGEHRAEVVLAGGKTELRWFAGDEPRKSVPAAVRRDHPEELKELKILRKNITKMLAAQRDRLERLPLARRSWSCAEWRERYLEQPLIGPMVARMLWRFEGDGRAGDGIACNGHLVDVDGCPLNWLTPDTRVRPWHPVDSDASEVLAWRTFLEEREITQPFKQAHREVYLLTEAERRTGTYSNRFAAHVLRQHQFNSLCAARGWRNQLRLMVDDDYDPASVALPEWGLLAEFWVEGLGDEYGVDTNDTGTFLHLGTDQVRFYRLHDGADRGYSGGVYYGGAQPVPLEEIPPLVLSEVLRDVDLFVGVASVGNDPTWQDGGPNGRYRDYWHSYAFGDLGVSARSRKEVLEKLLPRLELRERCSLEGRFLRVRGNVRSYRIHLGSGNVLMEPNDQYLCIVQGRGGAFGSDRLFLPFEGDGTLALILSKAFLLAADDAIDDPTIVAQIRS